MWPLKSILYFVLFWAGCALALFSPIWGVVNYLFVYQTDPIGTWWGQPLAALGMRFSMLAALFTILGLFFGRKRVPTARPLFSLWEIGLLALIAMGALNLVLGVVYAHHGRFAFEKLWKMLVFVLLLTRLGSDRAHLRLILWALVLGSLYLGHDAYAAGRSSFFLGRLNRVGGSDFTTTSGLSAHLAAMLPLIGTAFLITDKWRWKALATVSAAFTVNAIVLCRTRSAFLGLVCGAAAALLMAPRVKRFRIHLLLIAGAVAAFSLTDTHFWDRMNTLTDSVGLQSDQATVTRIDIWKASLRILADFPQGIGVGNFRLVIGAYEPLYAGRGSHNTVLVCLVELGIFGGVVFVTLCAGSLWYLWRASRLAAQSRDPLETKVLAYGLFASFVTYFVAGLGTERFYCESFWWVLALPLCLYRLTAHEAATGAWASPTNGMIADQDGGQGPPYALAGGDVP